VRFLLSQAYQLITNREIFGFAWQIAFCLIQNYNKECGNLKQETNCMAIKKKILTDENNQPVAVQIDYKDWLKFEKILEKSIKQKDLSEFSGKISLSVDPIIFQKNIRDEWN
jgi:hypothetical protein